MNDLLTGVIGMGYLVIRTDVSIFLRYIEFDRDLFN